MSDKLGTVQYGERAEHIYIGRDITKNEEYSEETAREIDLEIKRIVSEAKACAEKILTEHRDKLDKLAGELLEKETMDVAEIRRLLDLPSDEKESDAVPKTSINITA
jgi:cell division protease FtsH